MKKNIFILSAILFSGTSFGQIDAVSLTAEASADIVSPLIVTAPTTGATALNFGRISSSSGGAVTISPDGVRSGTGYFSSSTFSAASFSVNAADGYTFTVTIPDATLTHESEVGTLIVTDLQHNLGSLVGTGEAVDFNVGGTLTVPEGKKEGNFSGEVKVTISYQ